MSSRAWILAVCLACLAATAAAQARAVQAEESRVEAVTLYRGQALVTRSVPLGGAAGRVELVVGDLPQEVVGDSLFAEGDDAVAVRAVRYRTRPVGEAPREEVRQLEEQAQAVGDKLARNQRLQQLVARRLAFLEQLEGFTAPTAKAELSKGVLNFDALQSVTLFVFEQRQKAADEALQLAIEQRELKEQLSVLQREKAKLTKGASRTAREAVIFLDKRGGGDTQVRLSYLVKQATWAPAYNFRATRGGDRVRVEYNAVVQQVSGEDWSNVQLTLSTASPALAAEGPGLAPFRVALVEAKGQQRPSEGEPAARLRQAKTRLRDFQGRQQAAASLRESRDMSWMMNTAANQLQGVELAAGREALRMLTARPSAGDDVSSVTYPLDSPVSLASRSDQQMLRIAQMELPCSFYRVATPILTSYVYREAELTNTGSEALLTGDVNVYLDGRFVGRGKIPTVAKGEKFVTGFGADPQVRARRELVEKTEGVQGGNREIDLTYRLVLENYKETPVPVRLYDRMPVPARSSDIRVSLGELSDELSEDKLYLRLERPKGILRWDLEVPARAAGEDARIVRYSYKLEFAKNLHLSTPADARSQEGQKEFERLQYQRYGF
ncbi:MAG: mucoidy inhibitor MuiA family protein [Candidatus Brocadiia bacterium]